MIQTSALLHQRQRIEDADGRIVATAADYCLARSLLQDAVAKRLGMGVSAAAEKFLKRLEKRFAFRMEFTTDQAARGESVTDRSVREWLHELERAGRVEVLRAGRGGKNSIWLLRGKHQMAKRVLPEGVGACTGNSTSVATEAARTSRLTAEVATRSAGSPDSKAVEPAE
jgi:hypothetical protein